jgi:hypothetical protein
MIQYYFPATWAEHEFWEYHTPIYMLIHTIWLQAVVEIITSETAKALNILDKQQANVRIAIYQNCLPWTNYLPPREGYVENLT